MPKRRRFNTSERVAAYLIAGGKCEDCGEILQPGWHGDHKTPYSLGGPTDAINIRALCPKCNLKKGNKTVREKLREWPARIELRDWQKNALDTFIRHEGFNFLAVATPGAGKTIFAMRAAHLMLSGGKADRVVVVVPTSHLRKQWVKAAAGCEIDLCGDFENADGREARDYHGIVVTYAAIASQRDLHRGLVGSSRTFVILDEVHHAGGNLSWGDAVLHAFQPAVFRLCMSGTPFRRDSNPIPFVEYENNKSRADYDYGYAAALREEEVCRTVFFPKFEGEISWLSDDEMRTHNFDDELTDEEAGQRLRAALLAPTWLEDVIREAHGELTRIREEHPQAGGLLIAMDQTHAKEAAHLVKKVTGYDAVIAISEDEDASRHIDEFNRSSSPWIVAVKMVSEGVDIPRLRVCVYATNVTTALFFRQAVGRIVRWIKGVENPDAFFFIPNDRRLVTHALEIKHERDHVIREQYEKALRELEGDGNGERPGTKPPIIAYDATARPDGAVHDGAEYDQASIRRVDSVAKKYGISPIKFLAALREYGEGAEEKPQPEPVRVSKDDRKAQLRRLADRSAKQLAGIIANNLGKTYKESIEYVHKLCLAGGHKTPRQADEQGLMRRVEYLQGKLKEMRNGSV